MKYLSYKLFIVILCLMININISYADVTFTDADASKLVVEVESGRINADRANTLILENAQLEIQNDLLREQVSLVQQKLDSTVKTSEEVKKTYEEELAKCNPTFFQKVKSDISIFLAGSATGMLVIGLLLL